MINLLNSILFLIIEWKSGLYLSLKTYTCVTIMKKIALFFIGLLLVAASCNPSRNEPKTLLWKISGNGLQKPSYLFGTWHGDTQFRNTSFLDSIPSFYDALDSADVFVGEQVAVKEAMKEFNIEFQKNRSKEMRMPGDTLLKDLLDEGQIAKLDSFIRRKLGGRSTSAKINLRPAVITFSISFGLVDKKVRNNIREKLKELDTSDSLYNKKRIQLLAEADIMDVHLQKYSYTHGKEIIGLDELSGCNTNALFQSGKTLKEEADSLMSFINKFDTLDYVKFMDESGTGMREAYRRQDIFKVYEQKRIQLQKLYSIYPDDSLALKKISKEILYDRNYSWMKVIPDIIKEKSTFIAVGAVHLGGEEGLIDLLKKEGYTIEPVN